MMRPIDANVLWLRYFPQSSLDSCFIPDFTGTKSPRNRSATSSNAWG
jgi:hypothetical protein